jgi:hypothetical protein
MMLTTGNYLPTVKKRKRKGLHELCWTLKRKIKEENKKK